MLKGVVAAFALPDFVTASFDNYRFVLFKKADHLVAQRELIPVSV